MKFSALAAATLILSGSVVLAQNASTGSTTTTGDSAVSPASPKRTQDPANGITGSAPGEGINSGAMNNGTTGDTIGTGRGTSNEPARPSSR
jgi:hypothetical protein